MFYAVRVGRTPGVYMSWAECKAQTHGFKRAVYKSFHTREEAEAFCGIASPSRTRSAPSVPRLRIYVDGSCPQNVGAAARQGAAGWGMVVVKDAEELDFYGPVVFDASDPLFLGATRGTNNTGELSGIAMALMWLLQADQTMQPCTLLYDSDYAANIAQGLWKAKDNLALAQTVQRLLREARQRREVTFQSVKGHSGDIYNDRADRNANSGASGQLQIWPGHTQVGLKRERDSASQEPELPARKLARQPNSTNTGGDTMPISALMLTSRAPQRAVAEASHVPHQRPPAPPVSTDVPQRVTASRADVQDSSSPVASGAVSAAPQSFQANDRPTHVFPALRRTQVANVQNLSADPPPEVLQALVDMGFDKDAAVMALNKAQAPASVLDRAVEILLAGGADKCSTMSRIGSKIEILD